MNYENDVKDTDGNELISYRADYANTGDVVMVFGGDESNPIMVSDTTHFYEMDFSEENVVVQDDVNDTQTTYGFMPREDYAIMMSELETMFG